MKRTSAIGLTSVVAAAFCLLQAYGDQKTSAASKQDGPILAQGALAEPRIELGEEQPSPNTTTAREPQLIPRRVDKSVPVPNAAPPVNEPLTVPVTPERVEEAPPPSPAGGYLGIVATPVPEALAAQLDAQLADGQGLIVASVSTASPADVAGLRKHDVLVGLGGMPLTNSEQLVSLVRKYQPGEVAEIEYLRGGTLQKTEVTIGVRPPLNTFPVGRQQLTPIPPRPIDSPDAPAFSTSPGTIVADVALFPNEVVAKFVSDAPAPPAVQAALLQRAPYLMSNYRVIALKYDIVGPGLYQGVAILADNSNNQFECTAAGTLTQIKLQCIDQLLRLP